MDSLTSLSFPPLNPLSTTKTPVSSTLDPLWSSIVASPEPFLDSLPVSLIETPEVIVPFNKDYTAVAASEWKLSLVGYSVGKRPYYEALLSTAKRIWKLIGTFQLIALNDGFFLFKFSNAEDYEMVWSKGAWFFHGKPFVFQKWSKTFQPTRENFSTVLIWVRIIDLPLVCWNSEGISKIASKIGTPLSVDVLTAVKTRLTYARVCIQVATTSEFPETVPISIEDVVYHLKIQYEWKPNPCTTCKSMAHTSSYCPSNSQPPQQESQPPRGRSTSRNNRRKHTSEGPSSQIRSLGAAKKHNITSTASTSVHATSSIVIIPSQVTIPTAQINDQEFDTGNAVASTTGIIAPKSISALTLPIYPSNITIPNLNSPTDECIGNLEQESTSSLNNPLIPTKNQFDTLQNCEEQCINNLDVVNNSTHDSPKLSSLPDPFFFNSYRVFDYEDSCHNFHCANPGRIWLKWATGRIVFNTLFISNQMIAGMRSVNPIHIKLDRMLVNGDWLAAYPKSHYVIKSPSCSDHSPIVLLLGNQIDSQHRFFFKNFWLNSKHFWGNPGLPLNPWLLTLTLSIGSKKICLSLLNQDCNYESISKSLKTINVQLAEASSTWYSWISQRAKIKWLSKGEDDLKFLYSKILLRRNYRSAAISLAMSNSNLSYAYVIKDTISHFQRIYNPPRRHSFDILHFLVGKIIPPEYILPLTTPFTDAEIKKVSGFIQNWVSTDNVILANEILFHSRNTPQFKMLCAKLDIKKAFDCVSRDFLLARMHQKGFPLIFIKWINACINDVWFSVCIDGALHSFFPSTAGLRQGCPLSPYLFCIVMDAFSCLLDNDNVFEAPMVEGIKLSHLMYADDLLIFGKADAHNCELLCRVIERFSMASGLEVNYQKSTLFLSKYCHNPNEISTILQIPCTSTTIAYLGIPISPYNPKISDFSKLMETVTQKLSEIVQLQQSSCFLGFHKYVSPWKPLTVKSTKFWKNISFIALKTKDKFIFNPTSKAPISLYWDHWCNRALLQDTVGLGALLTFFPDNARLSVILNDSGWNLPPLFSASLLPVIAGRVVGNNASCLTWDGEKCP
ncbi:hypothetical protein KFK09_017274 [Dendrobium nobile]|uniref:Reverse transcriptase domain-containing protein n=1 Tax=Dendrobium nobile TaxID=94219 RepID=A0A8T3B0K1_DENNO|nr:hypothetical protein KFK09_017274 [Dendrobium nobile]